jgi:hypothetical protein
MQNKLSIKWTPKPNTPGADDFNAKSGGYHLRTEQMDRKRWWWCVYYRNEPIAAEWDKGIKNSATKQSAMRKAMIRARRHFYQTRYQKLKDRLEILERKKCSAKVVDEIQAINRQIKNLQW